MALLVYVMLNSQKAVTELIYLIKLTAGSLYWVAQSVNCVVSLYLIPIIMAILVVLMGGALTLFERKVLATYQCRIGPDVVGERGRLQFLVDALKVLLKEVIFLNKVNKKPVVMLPIAFLLINVYFVFLLEYPRYSNYLNWEYTPLLLLLLLALSNYLIVMVGLTLKNRYTRLASIRAANMGVSIDLLFAVIVGVMALANGTITYVSASGTDIFYTKVILVPVVPAVLVTVLADIGKPPFDIVESESELIMGVHSDLSGFLFVVWLLGEYLHIFILSGFLANFCL
jgi:NADH-quinone oxidoreductase subunit H